VTAWVPAFAGMTSKSRRARALRARVPAFAGMTIKSGMTVRGPTCSPGKRRAPGFRRDSSRVRFAYPGYITRVPAFAGMTIKAG